MDWEVKPAATVANKRILVVRLIKASCRVCDLALQTWKSPRILPEASLAWQRFCLFAPSPLSLRILRNGTVLLSPAIHDSALRSLCKGHILRCRHCVARSQSDLSTKLLQWSKKPGGAG